MSDSAFYALVSLSLGPKHGYALDKDVRRLSGGRTGFAIGNLYVLLERWREEGTIEFHSFDGVRKTYRLTSQGQRLLNERGREIVQMGKVWKQYKQEKKVSPADRILAFIQKVLAPGREFGVAARLI